jgi:branched-chain amino acid transport system permease protein
MEKSITNNKIMIGVVLLIILALPIIVQDNNFRHIMILFVLYAALGEAWNIITGYAGQTSFGHAAFFGIGAYTSTVLLWKFDIIPWIGMLIGGIIAVVVAIVVSYPAFKLTGHYFAIATLAIGEIMLQLFVSWEYVEGATGIMLPIKENGYKYMQFHPMNKLSYYYIVFGLFVITVITAYIVGNSKMGFYLKAIKENPDAAQSIGINVTRYKLYAMMVSAFLTAIVGSFYAQYVTYIDPFMVFPLALSMQIVLITVIGGLGNIYGPILGAAILIPLSQYTRIIFGGTGKGLDLIIFGALVVIVTIFQPNGLVGLFENLFKKIKKKEAISDGKLHDVS